ncbi:MAG TPA: hypothetical protein DCQ31_17780 [Bacteroidales bacterium]|nr:hypothetical protein [Bacteroidales bacterium]
MIKILTTIVLLFLFTAVYSQGTVSVTKSFINYGILEFKNSAINKVSVKIYNRWGNTAFSLDTTLANGTHRILFGHEFEVGTYYSFITIDAEEFKDFLTKTKL